MKRRTDSVLQAIVVIWVLFFGALFAIEVIGYHVLGVHENSLANAPPMIFGLIHGSTILHLYYFLFPLLIIGLFEASASVACRAKQTIQAIAACVED